MFDWSFLYLCSEWAVRLTMLLYVPQRRSASAARTWLLFIFLLPWPGLAIYALVGRIRVPAFQLSYSSFPNKPGDWGCSNHLPGMRSSSCASTKGASIV